MPGLKDKKSVKVDGKSVLFQKRLVLENLKEVFLKFRSENPDIKMGISKFGTLRPAHCILAGSGGTHIVCVCPVHENIQLMVSGN